MSDKNPYEKFSLQRLLRISIHAYFLIVPGTLPVDIWPDTIGAQLGLN